MALSEQVNALDRLHAEARRLRARSDALQDSYARTTWCRFVAVFFPIPFVVVLLRLELEAWHFYLAGGGYIVFAGALYAFDTAKSARCDDAQAAAQTAEQAYNQALGAGARGA